MMSLESAALSRGAPAADTMLELIAPARTRTDNSDGMVFIIFSFPASHRPLPH